MQRDAQQEMRKSGKWISRRQWTLEIRRDSSRLAIFVFSLSPSLVSCFTTSEDVYNRPPLHPTWTSFNSETIIYWLDGTFKSKIKRKRKRVTEGVGGGRRERETRGEKYISRYYRFSSGPTAVNYCLLVIEDLSPKVRRLYKDLCFIHQSTSSTSMLRDSFGEMPSLA